MYTQGRGIIVHDQLLSDKQAIKEKKAREGVWIPVTPPAIHMSATYVKYMYFRSYLNEN